MKHPHAELIRAFIEDTSLDIEYENAAGWEGWEIAYPAQLINDIHGVIGFRIKPAMRSSTLQDGTVVSWPEPMRVAPEIGVNYWIFDIYGGAYSVRWDGDYKDFKALAAGFCHLTEEDALRHHRAIVLVNGGEL